MTMISTEMIKNLREKTGVGMMECKKARRIASEGLVDSYIHLGKIGAMIEVNCETDFVARTDDFKELVKDIAMHIAAAIPLYLSRDDVPQDVIEREKEIYRAQVTDKPLHVVEKIIEGKLEKF